jgi:hypothetical protein
MDKIADEAFATGNCTVKLLAHVLSDPKFNTKQAAFVA